MENFESIMTFLEETEKLKSVLRKTRPIGLERLENSAEHSWQVALIAMSLKEYASTEVDICRAIAMLLLHDLVEIDCGDIMLYDRLGAQEEIFERESAAANRIFSILPNPTSKEYFEIWCEFEVGKTPTAQYAKAIDRILPLWLNIAQNGRGWKEHGITQSQVLRANSHISEANPKIWEYLVTKIDNLFIELES